MCFSAGASLGSSAILAVVGIVAIKKTQHKSQVVFASIPLVFALQQFTEGMVWLSFSTDALVSLRQIATIAFLIIAQVVWPLWIPVSVMLLEQDAKRKKILWGVVAMGIAVSIYTAYRLLAYNVHAEIASHHIKYILDFPSQPVLLGGILYLIATVICLFISSIKNMRILGLILFASFVLTKIFLAEFLISVWCFFAALISVIVLWIILNIKTKEVEKLVLETS